MEPWIKEPVIRSFDDVSNIVSLEKLSRVDLKRHDGDAMSL